uniref:Tail fiber assembly protein n=1 Tax=Nitratidesulfovibrio vulgaris (strain DSM 19637 / Miyazaki F) TaxID=883 RepID=B8DL06_NITV9
MSITVHNTDAQGMYLGATSIPERFSGQGLPAFAYLYGPPDTPLPSAWHRWKYQGDAWGAVEDHRGRAGWLADGTPHTVTTLGPLPDGWTDTSPPPALAEVVAGKQAAIRTGYDTALAGVIAGAGASVTGVAVESAMMAATDPDGLAYLVDLLTARRVALEQALLAAQAGADAVAAVLAIVVSYPT